MPRILVIDDEEHVRDTLRAALESKGHTVTEACNGDEGMQLFAAERADLVITDILMPGKDGIQTIKELRQLHPDVKIVAMSGGGRLNATDFLEVARSYGRILVTA